MYQCKSCGYQSTKWIGTCLECGSYEIEENTEEEVELKGVKKRNIKKIKDVKSINHFIDEKFIRRKTGVGEFDRVLGGGLVDGSLVLLSGEPGIGKSTLILQTAGYLSTDNSVLYVSGEESVGQIATRAKRIVPPKYQNTLKVISNRDVDSVLDFLSKNKYDIVIIDSIHTMTTGDLNSTSGSVAQIKETTNRIMKFAKRKNVSFIIIGHVTKDGILAGPKVLEHLVDVVINLEGEKHSGFRILRANKNRFGTTSEIGIFEMKEQGLIEVKNPSTVFLSDGNNSSGVCLSAILEGSRVILVEVQALNNSTVYSLPKRVTNGINLNRLQMLLAITSKFSGISFSNDDVYSTISGGVNVKEPGIDLAIILALVSAKKKKVLPNDLVAIGEVSLSGVIKKVPLIEKKVKECKRLGYKNIIYRQDNKYKNIKEVIREVF